MHEIKAVRTTRRWVDVMVVRGSLLRKAETKERGSWLNQPVPVLLIPSGGADVRRSEKPGAPLDDRFDRRRTGHTLTDDQRGDARDVGRGHRRPFERGLRVSIEAGGHDGCRIRVGS